MKNDTTTTVLNLVLGVLALAGVLFALLAILRIRDFRTLQLPAAQANANMMQAQALINDVAAYNQKFPSPELGKLIQPTPATPAKPAAR
jgi:hypothetical protein